jgi:serine/threonine protein kinase
MSDPSPTQTTQDAFEQVVNQICDAIQDGQPVDIESLAVAYPGIAAQLRSLYPTLLAIATLEPSACSPAGNINEADHRDNEKLGDFHIVRQIGRGGMGVVYEARQLSIHRAVALKILPLASLVDGRALQRFKNEVAAIATLEHPNIVSVYAIGEERGIHYYAMQLVRGQSLAAVIRALRSQAETEGSVTGAAIQQVVSDLQHASGKTNEQSGMDDRLSETAGVETRAGGRSTTDVAKKTDARITDQTYFRNVTRLTIQAADALQHAHDQGIVHRDVKPGNLLLDTHGTLFVTDFGLARIETVAGVTVTGDVLGTLRYMSPEQVLAKRVVIDHRTDVYSLGATLYELLTLQPLWSGDDKAGLIRQISFEEPLRPQRLNPAIPSDLETIVLKAISKNPADRYQSAQEFADDLQCLLEHKPIRARRPTLAQRINKWTRRHPNLVAATLFFLLIVTLGSVVSTALITNANSRTRKALAQSENSLDRVIDAVNTLLWRVGESQLEDVPGTEQLRRELLNDAMEICNSLIDSEDESPRARLRGIEALSSLGSIQTDLGDDESAGKTLKLAITRLEDWLEQHPNHPSAAKARYSKAVTYINLGSHYSDLSDYQRASQMYERGFELQQDLPANLPQVDTAGNQLLRGVTYANYATVLNHLNQDRAACEACQQAINLFEQLIDNEPGNASYRVYLGFAYSRLAASHKTLNERDLAARYFERAVNLLRQWGDQSRNRVWSRSILGTVCENYALLLANDDRDRARSLLLASESAFSRLHRQFPDYPDYQSSLAGCYKHLADIDRELGKHAAAVDNLEHSLPLRRDLVQRFPDRPDYRSALATTLLSYVVVLDLVNNKQAAEAAHAESIQIFEQLVEEHPEIPDYRFYLAREYYNSAVVLDLQGQQAKADQVLEKAVSISDPLLTDFPNFVKYRVQLSDIHAARGSCLLTLEQSEAALEQTEKATVLMRQVLEREPDNTSYQEKMLNLQITQAATQCSLRKFGDALQIFLDALPYYENRIRRAPANPVNKYNYSGLLSNVALAYRELDQPALTARYMEQALLVDKELLVSYPAPYARIAITDKTQVLLKAYSRVDEPKKLAARVKSAQQDVEEFLEELNSNERLYQELIDLSVLIGNVGNGEQSQSLLEKCLQAGQRDFGSEHELTLTAANRLGLAHMNAADWESACHDFEQIIDIRTSIHREQPENARNTLMLGGAYCNLGNARSQTNVDAIESYTSAIELLESVDEHAEIRNRFLKNACQGRAETQRRKGRFADSLADFDRALDLAVDEKGIPELQLKRLKTRAQQGDYADAAKRAGAIVAEPGNDHLAYDAASVFAIAARMAEDGTPATDGQQQGFRTYRARAMELLEIAREAGRFDDPRSVYELTSDPDFSAIRVDQSFDPFVNGLTSAATEK